MGMVKRVINLEPGDVYDAEWLLSEWPCSCFEQDAGAVRAAECLYFEVEKVDRLRVDSQACVIYGHPFNIMAGCDQVVTVVERRGQ